MNHYEIATKLIGPISPVGECHTDEKRAENLTEMMKLIGLLIDDVVAIAPQKDRNEASIKSAGERAYRYIDDLKISLEEDLENISEQ